MKPIGILMREHRLIEKMIDLLKEELVIMNNNADIDIDFIEVDIYFFRIYADRIHHGKEEDILFKQLAGKPLSSEHREMVEKLLKEHEKARGIVSRLDQSKRIYEGGNIEALRDIKACISELVLIYPVHIEKEDKQFFYPSMDYFTDEEQMAMLRQFREFDIQMIHEKNHEETEQLKEVSAHEHSIKMKE